jgi:hypothetical protein
VFHIAPRQHGFGWVLHLHTSPLPGRHRPEGVLVGLLPVWRVPSKLQQLGCCLCQLPVQAQLSVCRQGRFGVVELMVVFAALVLQVRCCALPRPTTASPRTARTHSSARRGCESGAPAAAAVVMDGAAAGAVAACLGRCRPGCRCTMAAATQQPWKLAGVPGGRLGQRRLPC